LFCTYCLIAFFPPLEYPEHDEAQRREREQQQRVDEPSDTHGHKHHQDK
jgi:hypothetical protein